MGLRILDRYIFKEISISSMFSFAVFLGAGLIAGFLPLLQKGLESGAELTIILFQVLVHALPGALVTVAPLSITAGILLGLGRLAADNEISAIKAAGVSVLRLAPPALLIGLIGFTISLVCTLWLIPQGISQGKRLMQDALTKRVDAGIEEGVFFDKLKNLILYVEKIDSSTGVMSKIYLRETSDPKETNIVMAKKGKVSPDPEGKAFILDLRDGIILREDQLGDSTGALAFETYVFRFPLDKNLCEPVPQSFEEISIREIRQRIATMQDVQNTDDKNLMAYYARARNHAGLLITQRFTHPLACVALAFIAFPIGVLNLGRSRLNNVSVGLGAIFVYYALTLMTERIVRSGLAPAEFVLPLPALVFMFFGTYFTLLVRNERNPRLFVWVQNLFRKIKR